MCNYIKKQFLISKRGQISSCLNYIVHEERKLNHEGVRSAVDFYVKKSNRLQPPITHPS